MFCNSLCCGDAHCYSQLGHAVLFCQCQDSLQFFEFYCKNSQLRHSTSCLLKWGTLWFSPSSPNVLLPSLKRVKWLKYSETYSDGHCVFSIDSIVVCIFFGCVRSGSKGAFSGTSDCDSLSWRVAEQWHRLPSAVGQTWAALSRCTEMRGCFCPVQSLFQCPSFIPSWWKNPSNPPNSRNKSAARQENSCTNDQL